jgi:hypothetical protein
MKIKLIFCCWLFNLYSVDIDGGAKAYREAICDVLKYALGFPVIVTREFYDLFLRAKNPCEKYIFATEISSNKKYREFIESLTSGHPISTSVQIIGYREDITEDDFLELIPEDEIKNLSFLCTQYVMQYDIIPKTRYVPGSGVCNGMFGMDNVCINAILNNREFSIIVKNET